VTQQLSIGYWGGLDMALHLYTVVTCRWRP